MTLLSFACSGFAGISEVLGATGWSRVGGWTCSRFPLVGVIRVAAVPVEGDTVSVAAPLPAEAGPGRKRGVGDADVDGIAVVAVTAAGAGREEDDSR